MADLTNADLTDADLTQAYTTGFVIQDLKKIENTDWSEVDMRKDQRKYLCGPRAPRARTRRPASRRATASVPGLSWRRAVMTVLTSI